MFVAVSSEYGAGAPGVHRIEPVDAVDRAQLNIEGPVFVVDDVPLVVDRAGVARRGEDLLGVQVVSIIRLGIG